MTASELSDDPPEPLPAVALVYHDGALLRDDDVRCIGRPSSASRSILDNERIDRALGESAHEPSAINAPKVAFVRRPRNMPASAGRRLRQLPTRPKDVSKPTTTGPLGIASFIGADTSPPRWLVEGLHESLERLIASLHPKKRPSTEVRAAMCRVDKSTRILQDLLKDTELLSHLSPDNIPNRNQFFAGLNWIAKRAAIAATPGKQGRPKTRFDLSSVQFQCAIIVAVAWRMVWQQPLSDGDIDGQQTCEMIWQALGRTPHQPSSTRLRRSKQEGVIALNSFEAWGEWMEKARKALEAPQEDSLTVEYAREVERTFHRAAARR